jgi:hypothetical protein
MAYTKNYTVTFQSGQVPSNQTNFPAVIYGTYSYLATTAHGGYVQNTTTLNSQTVPADLIFTSDAGGSTLLNWEVAYYNATTGAIEVWVQIPTLSSSSNTTIYMWVGNAAVTTYQCTATSTWDSNFKAVYHLSNGSTLSLHDSTVNNQTTNANSTGTTPTAVSGKVDGGMQIYGGSGTSGSGLNISPISTVGPNPPFTVQGWFYPTASTAQAIFGSTQSVGDLEIRVYSDQTINVLKNNIAQLATTTATANLNAWNFVSVAVDSSDNIIINLNGTAQTFSGAYSSIPNDGVNTIGYDVHSDVGMTGYIDEVEWSATNRTANYIMAQYNNQSSPSSFYTISPVSPGTAFNDPLWFGMSC